MPLSITVLKALEPGPRADELLDALQSAVRPSRRQHFGGDNAVRLRHDLLPEQARAETERRLQAIDAAWRDCIAIR